MYEFRYQCPNCNSGLTTDCHYDYHIHELPIDIYYNAIEGNLVCPLCYYTTTILDGVSLGVGKYIDKKELFNEPRYLKVIPESDNVND